MWKSNFELFGSSSNRNDLNRQIHSIFPLIPEHSISSRNISCFLVLRKPDQKSIHLSTSHKGFILLGYCNRFTVCVLINLIGCHIHLDHTYTPSFELKFKDQNQHLSNITRQS